MYTIELQVDSTYPRASADTSTYTRMLVEFPTLDSLGNRLFLDDLGGYTKSGELVGCYMYPYTSPYIDSPGNDLRCRLVKSEVAGEPAQVEILNFRAFSGSQYRMKVRMVRIYNPATSVVSVPISIRIDHVVDASN